MSLADVNAPAGMIANKTMPHEFEEVGVILVHGIGEQRRFQHLDWQLRDLIRALQTLQGRGQIDRVSVDMASAGAAAFHADQDTWTAGPRPSVTIVVHHQLGTEPRETRLRVHEVWWADVNEPYSLAKQYRFWLWGLAVWLHPGKKKSKRPSADRVEPISVGRGLSLWNRIQLFLVGAFFVLIGYSVGVISFLLSRLFNLQQPKLLRVIANYVSAVKLYSQRRRFGEGLVPHCEEFLDTIGEPPRVSIRRRMMRVIADVACNKYARWYVLAHSQGTVVAFNGLMDTAYAWPGYLDERRWKRMKRAGFAGPASGKYHQELPPPANRVEKTQPRRPAWIDRADIVYRDRIFGSFRGFLTYGSPLAKFAGIWPAVVPVSREPAFSDSAVWINLYDPLDPVSGRLSAFRQSNPRVCPPPIDLGYASSWGLLLAHLKYFTSRPVETDAAIATVSWLLTSSTDAFLANNPGARGAATGHWFDHRDRVWWVRTVFAYASWIIAAVILIGLGALILPLLLKAASKAVIATWRGLRDFAPDVGSSWLGRFVAATLTIVQDTGQSVGEWVVRHLGSFSQRMLLLGVLALALPIFIGLIARIFPLFERDEDDPA